MTNASPSDAQWLVLHQVDDGEVWYDGVDKWGKDRWRAKGAVGSYAVTGAVQRLYGLGLIEFEFDRTPKVNKDGAEALKRRSVYEVLERMSRRRG